MVCDRYKRSVMRIYEDGDIFIEKEESEIPWVKIFTHEPYKELTDAPADIRAKLWRVYEITEKEMLEYYSPKKINMASFGNYLPHLHIHVMARFEDDSFFPEPMWGKKQRESILELPSFEEFAKRLYERLTKEL